MFLAGNSTVTLNGGDQAIWGATIFNHLKKTCVVPVKLMFEAGEEQRVNGELTLTGTSSSLLSLVSSVDGIHWKINPGNQEDVSYVSIKDGYNLRAMDIVCGKGYLDAGNNVGFRVLPVLDGPVYFWASNYLIQLSGGFPEDHYFYRMMGKEWFSPFESERDFRKKSAVLYQSRKRNAATGSDAAERTLPAAFPSGVSSGHGVVHPLPVPAINGFSAPRF